MILESVGKHIAALRKDRLNISQQEFARQLGYDRTYMSRVETGKQNLTLESLEKICTGLGMTVKEFFKNL